MSLFYPVDHLRVQHNYTGSTWQDFTGDLVSARVNLREFAGTHTASLSFYRANMDPSQGSGTRVIKKGDIVRISAHNGAGKRRRMARMVVRRVSVEINLKAPVGRQNRVTVHLHGTGVAGVAGTGGSSGVGSNAELSNVVTGAAYQIDADANTYAWTGTTGASTSTETTPEGVLRTNLCTNGSFEHGTTGWGGFGATIAQSTDWSDDGGYSVKVTSDGTQGTNSFAYYTQSLTSGHTYTISATCRIENTLTGTLGAASGAISAFDATFANYYVSDQALNSEGETRLTMTFTAAISNGHQIRLNVASDAVGQVVYWDSVTIEETSTDKGYFDGDSSGYAGAGITTPTDGTLLRTNLVENPSFETNTTGWVALSNCSISRSTTVGGFAGSAALRLSSTASGTMSSVVSGTGNMAPVTVGASYDASCYVRSGASTRTANLQILWYTSGGSLISTTTAGTGTTTTGGFTRLSGVGKVAPATAAFAAMGIQIVSTGGASELHYADAFLFEASDGSVTARTYFDGDTADDDTNLYAWTGTAGTSSSTQTATFTEIVSINTASERDQILLTRDSNPGTIGHEDPDGAIVVYDSDIYRTLPPPGGIGGGGWLSLDDTDYSDIDQRFDMSHIINVLKIKYLEKVRVDKKHTRTIEHNIVYEDAPSIAKYGRFTKKIKVHKKSDFAAHATSVFDRNADPDNVPASVTIPILAATNLLGGYEDGHFVGHKVNVTLPDGVTVYTCRIKRIQHIISPGRWVVQLFLRDQNIHEHLVGTSGTDTEVGNNPDGAVITPHLDDSVGEGKTWRTGLDGTNHIAMYDDGDAGIIEFSSGATDEVAGVINPQVDAVSPKVPRIVFQSPSITSDTPSQDAGIMTLFSGHTAAGGASRPSLDVEGNINAVGGWLVTSDDIQAGNGLGSGSVSVTGDRLVMLNPPTTASAANVRVGAGGVLNTVTSLRAAKVGIELLSDDQIRGLLDVEPVSFFDRAEVQANGGSTEGLRRIPGVTAEDIEAKVPLLAEYDADGALVGVAYDRGWVLMLAHAREQDRTIREQQRHLELLGRHIVEIHEALDTPLTFDDAARLLGTKREGETR